MRHRPSWKETGLLALLGVFLLLLRGTGSHPGHPSTKMADEHSPDLGAYALATGALMTLELGLLWWILRPHASHTPWRRALAAVAVFVPWGIACLAVVLHMPGFVLVHAGWAVTLAVLSLLVLVAQLGSLAVARLRRGSVGAAREESR